MTLTISTRFENVLSIDPNILGSIPVITSRKFCSCMAMVEKTVIAAWAVWKKINHAVFVAVMSDAAQT